jgi:hypothetical protein
VAGLRQCRLPPRAGLPRPGATLVRAFVAAFQAARSYRIPFETFQAEMTGSPEAEAYFAWAGAAKSALFSSQVRNKRDAPQNGA